MKLMKRLMRRNNKGMSLVELICAVAILGLTTTALGGAMVMSARHYHRDSAEFEVQQEAQTATNLIGNLVVDAADANWAGNKLTIKADGKTHVIYQSGDKLLYENTSDGTSGVLAEGLATDGFKADTSKFEKNKNVNVSLKLKNGEKEFTSNYNATSRNGQLSTAEFAEQVCVISMEDEVVIEPNQPFEMEFDLLGMEISEVGNVISVDRTGVPAEWDTDDAIDCEIIDNNSGKIKLKAPANAGGTFTFVVKTGDKDPGVPWATKTVQVKVRRVDGIILNKASGDGYTVDSEYVFGAVVDGDYLSKGYGKAYDYDYMNPKYVQFEISGVDYEILEDKSKTDTPYIKFKLTSDMTPSDTMVVKAISAHARGEIGGIDYNKTGMFYKDVVAMQSYDGPDEPIPTPTPEPEVTPEPGSTPEPGVTPGPDDPTPTPGPDDPTPTPAPGGIDPDYPLPDLPSGMLRGEDYHWDTSTLSSDTLKGKLQTKYSTSMSNLSMHYEWYVSFKESGAPDTEWTPWHMTKQAGSNQKIDGTFETTIMLPDKAYDLRFFILYYDQTSKKVLYPHDESLLEPGNGLYEAGFTKGWADEDAVATSFVQYGRSTSLPAVSMYFYDSNMSVQNDSVGSESDPITYDFKDGGTTYQLNFNMRHLSVARTMYTYTPVIWKKDGSSWDKLDSTEVDKILKCTVNGGTPRYIQISDMQNQANTKDLRNAACGTYRIGLELAGTAQKYKSDAADSVRDDGFEDVTLSPMKLYNESNSNGFVYFKIINNKDS